jgi:purine-nucleoside phosphorylase
MASERRKRLNCQIREAADYIRQRVGSLRATSSELAIILGSGLDGFVGRLEAKKEIRFSSIPHFPRSSVVGHAGIFVCGQMGGVSICCLQGRIHYYECHDMKLVTFPVRVLGALGINRLIVTNAAGGLNSKFGPGDLMLIRDHLGLFVPNPLLGANLDNFGPRFPDMSECYSKPLQRLAIRCARKLRLTLKQGVYLGLSGPSYETPAEIGMLKRMGADAVGMSTIPEVIVARHMGIECLGISVITNLAVGISRGPLIHQEVLDAAERVRPKLTQFLSSLCHEISTVDT